MTEQSAGFVPQFTIYDRCRKAREHAGLDQETLARDIDISRATVTNYEQGHVSPRRGTLRQWALRCGVSFEWLATGQERPRPENRLEGVGLIVRDECAARDSNPEPAD